MIVYELPVGSGIVSRAPVEPRWYTTRGLRYYVSQRNYCTQYWTARADVAALTPDALALFEIKAGGDSLARLRTQVRAYDDTGSFNTLVVDEKHLRQAHDAVPPAWGIVVARGNEPDLEELRPAQRNPSCNVRGLCNPLYRRELLPLAHVYRARPGSQPDLVAFFGRYAKTDVELHERWLRRQIAMRKRFDWPDVRLDELLERMRRHHAGMQLELALQ